MLFRMHYVSLLFCVVLMYFFGEIRNLQISAFSQKRIHIISHNHRNILDLKIPFQIDTLSITKSTMILPRFVVCRVELYNNYPESSMICCFQGKLNKIITLILPGFIIFRVDLYNNYPEYRIVCHIQGKHNTMSTLILPGFIVCRVDPCNNYPESNMICCILGI